MNPHGKEAGVYSYSLLPRSTRPLSLHYDQNRHLLFSVLAHSQNKLWTTGTERCSGSLENWEFLLSPSAAVKLFASSSLS